MLHTLHKKIVEIQNSDERVRRAWLIGTSGITIVVVVGLWLIYIRATILPANYVAQEHSEVGFWEIMKTGTGIAGKNIYHQLGKIITNFKEEKTITIIK